MKAFVRKWNRSPMALLAAGFLALFGLEGAAIAQEKSPSNKEVSSKAALPEGALLMDEYTAAMGGTALLQKFSTRRSEGTLEIQAAGISGKISLLQAKPNKFLMTIDLPAIGVISNGSDGDTVWEDSVISGNRILEGEEREQLLRRTSIDADAVWRENYEAATTLKEEKIGDRAVWVVQLKPKGSDKLQTNYLDKETKLMLRSKMTMTSPMGEIAVESEFSDYREVDGLTIPFESKQTLLGQSQVMKITKVTHDEIFTEDSFSAPKKKSGAK